MSCGQRGEFTIGFRELNGLFSQVRWHLTEELTKKHLITDPLCKGDNTISTKLEELDEQAQFVLFKKITSDFLLYITREKMSDFDLKINIIES